MQARIKFLKNLGLIKLSFRLSIFVGFAYLLNACSGIGTLSGQMAPVGNAQSSGAYQGPLIPAGHKIAVLLPQSGHLAPAARAMQDGIMAAHKAQNNPVNVKFYNTAASDVNTLYQKALQEGADWVIGPLDKNQVDQLAQQPHPVPTLTLNYSSGHVRNPENFYQLGISPEQESIETATKIRAQGYARAIIIYPTNAAWGNRMVRAFSKAWEQQGGIIVDNLAFSNLHLLNKQIERLVGFNKNSKVHRRQDVDVIFLVSEPVAARQVKPLLNYYYAGNIPIYATSLIYSGAINPRLDSDLDGIIFSDMPWILKNDFAYSRGNATDRHYARLYALGIDAFNLSQQLGRLQTGTTSLDGASGILMLHPSQKIQRQLAWAKFQNGVPVIAN